MLHALPLICKGISATFIRIILIFRLGSTGTDVLELEDAQRGNSPTDGLVRLPLKYDRPHGRAQLQSSTLEFEMVVGSDKASK